MSDNFDEAKKLREKLKTLTPEQARDMLKSMHLKPVTLKDLTEILENNCSHHSSDEEDTE